MLFKSQVGSAVEWSLIQGGGVVASGEDRIGRARKAIGYLDKLTVQAEDLTEAYKPLYETAEGKAAWEKRPKACYNLMRYFVAKLGTLYGNTVLRRWSNDKGPEATRWAEISGPFQQIMAAAEQYSLPGGVVAVRPYAERGKPTVWRAYHAAQIEIDPSPEDATIPQQVLLSWYRGSGQNRVLHQDLWSADRFAHLVNGTEVPDDLYPDGKHKYGRIPLVFVRQEHSPWEFFPQPADGAVIANRTANKLCTDLNWNMNFGSGIMVTKMGDTSKPITIGLNKRVNFEDPQGDLYFASPELNADAAIATLNLNIALFCRSYNIPEDTFMVSRQGESGVAIVARSEGLREFIEKRAQANRADEADLTRLTLQIDAMHNEGLAKMPDFEEPSVTYVLPKKAMDAEERAEWESKVRLGTVSRADLVLAEDPTLDRKVAEKRVLDNLAFEAKCEAAGAPGFSDADRDGRGAV